MTPAHLPPAYHEVRDYNERWFRARVPQDVSVSVSLTMAQTMAHHRGQLLPPVPHLIVSLGSSLVSTASFAEDLDAWRKETLRDFRRHLRDFLQQLHQE